MHDQNESQCTNCERLWEKISQLESEIKKKDRAATWQNIFLGIFFGLSCCQFILTLIRAMVWDRSMLSTQDKSWHLETFRMGNGYDPNRVGELREPDSAYWVQTMQVDRP